MIRTNAVVHAAVAGVLLLPTISLSGERVGGLERSLEETVSALESLAGLRDDFSTTAGPRAPREDALRAVLGSTERPITDARVRDTILATLRDDVGRLQMELDRLRASKRQQVLGAAPTSPAGDVPVAALDHEPAAQGPAPVDPPLPPARTTGLDDGVRASLATLARPAGAPPRTSAPAAAAAGVDGGYSVDPVRQGHAWYRAGRYAEALAALERAGDAVEAIYWRARALERLERLDEALAQYQLVIARPDAGAFAVRAQSDVDFLQWKRDFGRRIERDGGESR